LHPGSIPGRASNRSILTRLYRARNGASLFPMLLEAILAVSAIIVVLAILLLVADRVERRRRARWWRHYLHEGGLVGSLVRRWNGTKRLTYRPDTGSADDA
jgi:hypothetical protein